MEAIAADGTRIAYGLGGRRDGEPVLLIQGLGADRRGWIMQERAFGRHHRLIKVDNRGVGRSGRPPGPYDLAQMAEDAIAVLDHAGYGSAHVVGASMGGIISQILAVLHPHRVRSLTLACTSAHHHPWRLELLAEWRDLAVSRGMREWTRRNLEWVVGPRSLNRLWPIIAGLGPIAFTVPVESFTAQIDAICAAPDRLRFHLESLRCPTLVLVGSQDVLTPRGDSEELAELIPGAELSVIRGGAHLFQVEHAAAFNRTVLDFLRRTTAKSSGHIAPLVLVDDESGSQALTV